jgi:phosphomannomutase
MSLMVSISGLRGVVGDSLTPETVVRYAGAFAEYAGRGPIVIGRDGRASGGAIAHLVSSTLLAMGSDVIALGVVPTPTVALAVEHLGAAGGIAITASHNPMEWNGLKFLSRTGMFLDATENKAFWSIVDAPRRYARWDGQGRHRAEGSFLQRHVDLVCSLPFVHPETIRKRHFKVVVDCINAAGGLVVPGMLRSLGCEVVEMNAEASGIFAHAPEPVPENLNALASAVREHRADLGIAVDPDVDRLVLITEQGEPFGEEYTITTVVRHVLEAAAPGARGAMAPVVVNLSTKRAVDDVARAFGVSVERTPVGEINVAARMKQRGSIIGGEGSGGVILGALHFGRDAIVGIGLVLAQLAESGGSLSALKASLPQYAIVKSKVELPATRSAAALDQVRLRHQKSGTVNTDDGLKIDFATSWVHLRRSNTEPIVRIIAEAPTASEAHDLVVQFQRELQQD